MLIFHCLFKSSKVCTVYIVKHIVQHKMQLVVSEPSRMSSAVLIRLLEQHLEHNLELARAPTYMS